MENKEEKLELKSFLRRNPTNKFLKGLFEQKISKENYERVGLFLKLLNQPKVNLVCLHSYSFRGIPNECVGLRGIVWRLLLGYLPTETTKWEAFVEEKHKEYLNSYELYKMPELTKQKLSYKAITKESELAKRIKVDIKRTKQEIPFFMSYLTDNVEETKNYEKRIKDDKYDFILDNEETHKLIISRLLYVFANTTPSMEYIQGMNEIVTVLYYCFYQDSGEELRQYCESDTYFCFYNLMSELNGLYFRDAAKVAEGIENKVMKIKGIIMQIDSDCLKSLEKMNARNLPFAIRWIMLLFAQDMDIDNIMRLWDTLLGDPERFLFFDHLVVEIVIKARSKTVTEDYHEFIKALKEVLETINLKEVLKDTGNRLAKYPDKYYYSGEHH